ncbi:NAD(+) synthase [Myroides sp. LJL116]
MRQNLTKNFVIDQQNVELYANKIATWIANTVKENNRKGVVLGMSGGIDCSLVACLCHYANIDTHLVMMPYGLDMEHTKSTAHSMELINKFGFSYETYDIKAAVDALTITSQVTLSLASASNITLSRANIRPRVRMTYLYELAQLGSRFVIGTGNLSERTVGYFTKWGDGAFDLNPLAMLTKKEVYILSEFLKVPEAILNKEPSAGLWEGQTDEQELGMSYAQIDSFILSGTSGDLEIDKLIEQRISQSKHKLEPQLIFLS